LFILRVVILFGGLAICWSEIIRPMGAGTARIHNAIVRRLRNSKFGGIGAVEVRMCLAIPGKIIEISADNPDSALVDVVSVRRRVDLALLRDEHPKPGDWVLIHVGFAMSKISEQDALDQMQTLRALGEAEAAIQEVQGYGLAGASEPEAKPN
jgi:hydrogenase expression/formation protein HypC